MGVLSDKQIRTNSAVDPHYNPMIAPFLPKSVKVDEQGNKIISKGLSSYGYDVTLAEELYLVHVPPQKGLYQSIEDWEYEQRIDPKDPDLMQTRLRRLEKTIVSAKGFEGYVMPPHSFVLGHTVETFNIPNDVLVHVTGKSTYARAGLSVTVTPIEPGFRGQVVLELANLTPRPLVIYPGEGICQFVFMVADDHCEVTYADRGGKYQDQSGVTLGKV